MMRDECSDHARLLTAALIPLSRLATESWNFELGGLEEDATVLPAVCEHGFIGPTDKTDFPDILHVYAVIAKSLSCPGAKTFVNEEARSPLRY